MTDRTMSPDLLARLWKAEVAENQRLKIEKQVLASQLDTATAERVALQQRVDELTATTEPAEADTE